jgi:hypothetical protein
MYQNRYEVNTYVKLVSVSPVHQAISWHVTVYGTTLTHGCEDSEYEDNRGL